MVHLLRTRGVKPRVWAAIVVSAVVGLLLITPYSSGPVGTCNHPEISVSKSETTLVLSCDHQETRRFWVTFGTSPSGQKEREGDGRTPEGDYRVTGARASARFDRFLALDYPNRTDLARAGSRGILNPGSAIGIHGVSANKRLLGRVWIRFAHVTRSGVSGGRPTAASR